MQPIIAQPHRLRFAVAVILAVCLASALAQDIEAPENRPIFVKPPEKAYFHETFQGDLRRWVRSKDEKFKDGDWAVGNGAKGSAIKGEQGLIVRGAAKHHAISVLLPDITTEKGLIVQYEVKLHTPLNCGGAYIKLLRSDPAFTQETMTNASPYVIMFGPDRCGTHDKVHFIFNHKNPLNGSYSEKHLKYPPNLRNDRVTHLYSLAIFPDNKFEIKIDQALVSRGSLLDDMTPPVNPPAEIDDPNDKPPADWVLEKRIPDPTHVKPADWDESQPAMIEDPDAVKPEGWLDDVEPEIQTDLKPPFDYDPVKDGPWLPPRMSNPACLNAPGCGPWTRPKIPNPKFKGKWMPRLIDNPAYKGEYKPRKIPNPDYFKDTEPYKMDPMGALGIELWTMQDDIEFDNFYIGYDVEDAYAFAERTWRPKYTKEKEEEEKGKPKRASTTPSAGVFSDPIQFFKDYPAAAVIAALFGAVILLFFCARLLVRKPEQGGEPDDEEEHSHSHSHSHSHDHGDHSHSHDHGHSHGSEPQATPAPVVEAPERKEEAPPGEDGLKQRKKGKPRKDQ